MQSITFAMFHWLEANYGSCPHSRRGDCTKVWTPGGRLTSDITLGSDHHIKQRTQGHIAVGNSVLWQERPEP